MERFETTKALIVEGSDDKHFITNFLKHLKIQEKIYVHEVGGDGNLASETEKSLLEAARDSIFKANVKQLAILFDGDGDQSKKFRKIRSDISKINKKFSELELIVCDDFNEVNQALLTPNEKAFEIKTFIFLFEKNLEDAFLKTLSEPESKIVKNCVSDFFKCAEKAKVSDKNRVQAFLSTKDEIRDIGAAARENIINFDHDSLKTLKNFLLNFSKL